MPLRIEIPITAPEGQRINPSWGSIMHGLFIELIPTELAGRLHTCEVTPWSQFIHPTKGNQGIWTLCAMSDEMEAAIYRYLLPRLSMDHVLKQKGFAIHLALPSYIYKCQWSELNNPARILASPVFSCSRHLVTPTAFKSAGKVVDRPDPSLIYHSLARRWNALSPDSCQRFPVDPAARELFEKGIEWQTSSIHSANFSANRVPMSGFQGALRCRVIDPEQSAALITLFRFAEYAGIGCKTALGMGGLSRGLR